MKNTSTVQGKILLVERLDTSYIGNPRYIVTIQTETGVHTYRTKVNASLGYSITNHEGRDVEAVV